MGTETYKFSYHDERRDSWQKWLVIHLMTQVREKSGKDDLWEEVMALTDGGKNVELQVIMNGREFDAKEIFERVFRNIDWAAQREAQKIVSQIPGFDELQDLIHDAQRELKWKLKRQLREMGIEINEEEW